MGRSLWIMVLITGCIAVDERIVEVHHCADGGEDAETGDRGQEPADGTMDAWLSDAGSRPDVGVEAPQAAPGAEPGTPHEWCDRGCALTADCAIERSCSGFTQDDHEAIRDSCYAHCRGSDDYLNVVMESSVCSRLVNELETFNPRFQMQCQRIE